MYLSLYFLFVTLISVDKEICCFLSGGDKRRLGRGADDNKNGINKEFLNNLYEHAETTRSTIVTKRADDVLLADVKVLLTKLEEKVNALEKVRNEALSPSTRVLIASTTEVVDKRQHKMRKRQRWGRWTEWSACSVTCGKGREIRWRHCVEGCDEVETEMEEKSCQLPACGPTKLFGIHF